MFSQLEDLFGDWDKAEIFQVDERVAPAGSDERNLTHLIESLSIGAQGSIKPMPVTAIREIRRSGAAGQGPHEVLGDAAQPVLAPGGDAESEETLQTGPTARRGPRRAGTSRWSSATGARRSVPQRRRPTPGGAVPRSPSSSACVRATPSA